MNTVDIGLAQLAMHASYETAGCADVDYMIRALRQFYKTDIITSADGEYQLRLILLLPAAALHLLRMRGDAAQRDGQKDDCGKPQTEDKSKQHIFTPRFILSNRAPPYFRAARFLS